MEYSVLRVEWAEPPKERSTGDRRLLEIERRDLPVVFYENGKEVARVPFSTGTAAAEDKELARFLESVKYGALVATSTVTKSTMLGGGAPPPGARGAESPNVEEVLFDWGPVLYGSRPESIRLGCPLGKEPRFAKGERLIFVLRGWRPEDKWVEGALYAADALKWSPEREGAVRFALAPGWQWDGRFFRCPWCRLIPVNLDPGQKCAACGQRFIGGGPRFKECKDCAALKGQCQMCDRKVGPATRGVELLLGTLDPLRKAKDLDPLSLTVAPGKAPELWLAAKLADNVKEAPEFKSHGGRSLSSCCGGSSLVLLVTNSSGQESAFPELVPQGEHRKWPGDILPLKASTSSSEIDFQLAAKHAFAKPGTYAVRAAAGRLVSNPVTVVVGEAEVVPAGPKALPPVPAPEPAPGPAAAGIQPRWQPGGDTVEAVDAVGGKLLWRANLGFAIGNVVAAGGRWEVTSQDGTKSATLDAATGKTLEQRQLRPAPEPF